MKYTWEDSDIVPGIKVREHKKDSRYQYGETELVIAVGSKDGGMYKYGLLKQKGNYCSHPMDKVELVAYLNEYSYEPVSD